VNKDKFSFSHCDSLDNDTSVSFYASDLEMVVKKFNDFLTACGYSERVALKKNSLPLPSITSDNISISNMHDTIFIRGDSP